MGGSTTEEERASAPRLPFPISKGTFQLATLADELPEGADWVYERKLDGYRAMAEVRADGNVRLLSRNALSLSSRFPTIVDELARIPELRGCIVDGEIVAYEGDKISFHALQKPNRASKIEYLIFDLLAEDGQDLRPLPYEERKARLSQRAPRRGMIRALPSLADSRQAKARARLFQDEGIMAKRRGEPYRGGRTTSWIKYKALLQDDFIVVGYQPSKRPGDPIGSLALATRDIAGGPLRYAGRVGTGFDREDRLRLFEELIPLRASEPACSVPASERLGVRWVLPELVIRVAYLEETEDGILRHPTFRGERDDITAAEVAREEKGQARESMVRVANGHEIVISNPDKILLPGLLATKAEIIDYYEAIAEAILPRAQDRPLQLVRSPDGPRGAIFYAHRPPKDAPPWLRVVHVEGRTDRKDLRILGGDLATLIWTVQLGCIEQHAWSSAFPDIEYPLELHVDLDPPNDDDTRLVSAARITRDILQDAGLVPYLKTSGKRGLHILAPLDARSPAKTVANLALELGKRIANEDPKRLTTAFAKKDRHGRLYVDVRRNRVGSSLAMAWSVRATPRGTVSTPLHWEELGPRFRKEDYDLRVVRERFAREGDPWKEMRENARSAELSRLSG